MFGNRLRREEAGAGETSQRGERKEPEDPGERDERLYSAADRLLRDMLTSGPDALLQLVRDVEYKMGDKEPGVWVSASELRELKTRGVRLRNEVMSLLRERLLIDPTSGRKIVDPQRESA